MTTTWHPKRYIIFIICLIVIIEVITYFVAIYLSKKGRVYYNYVTEHYETYISRRHPILGWLSAKQNTRSYDQFAPGAEGPKTCLSLYGAAFFVNEKVDPDYECDHVLSSLLNCKVANYGVGGYGTDQSYLTFHNNKQDDAKIVMLGFSSDHIRWNVNRLRNLIVPSPQLALKPRFIITGKDELQLIPIPSVTDKSFYRLSANPEKYLEHEFFLPGGLSGVQTCQFPYAICLFRLIRSIFQRIVWDRHPYEDFYQPKHPANALLITASIMDLFSQEANSQGRHPSAVLVPLAHDLCEFQKKGAWIYQPLIDQLNKRGVKYLNAGPEIIKYLRHRRPAEIFQNYGYLNNEGQKLLGSILYNYVASMEIPLGEDSIVH